MMWLLLMYVYLLGIVIVTAMADEWTVIAMEAVPMTEDRLVIDITVSTPLHWVDAVHRSLQGPRWLHVAVGMPHAWNASIVSGDGALCSSLQSETESSFPFRSMIRSRSGIRRSRVRSAAPDSCRPRRYR